VYIYAADEENFQLLRQYTYDTLGYEEGGFGIADPWVNTYMYVALLPEQMLLRISHFWTQFH
jgi:hypothetical protein